MQPPFRSSVKNVHSLERRPRRAWRGATLQQPAAIQLDLARTPLLGEEWLKRAVEAQERKPAFLRVGLDQLPRATPSGWVGPK